MLYSARHLGTGATWSLCTVATLPMPQTKLSTLFIWADESQGRAQTNPKWQFCGVCTYKGSLSSAEAPVGHSVLGRGTLKLQLSVGAKGWSMVCSTLCQLRVGLREQVLPHPVLGQILPWAGPEMCFLRWCSAEQTLVLARLL